MSGMNLETAKLLITATGVIVAVSDDDRSNSDRASLALIGLGGGALVGAGVGTAFKSEHWTQLPVDSRVGVRLGTGSSPLAVGICTRF